MGWTSDFYKELDSLFKLNKPEKIEVFFKKKLLDVQEMDDKNFVAVANEYASYLRVKGNTDQAYYLYNQVIEKLNKLDLTSSNQYAIVLINLGDVDIVNEDYNKALYNFNRALDILEINNCQDKRVLASAYNNRSVCYRNKYDYHKAAKDIKVALKFMKDDPSNKSRWATSMINLAEIYVLKGEYTKASEAILEALLFFKDYHEGNDIHYANALATGGQILYLTGSYEESILMYKQAIKNFEEKVGKSEIVSILEKNILKAEEQLKRL